MQAQEKYAIIISALPVVTLGKEKPIVDNNMESFEKQSVELSEDILQFTEMFSQLSPEAKDALLEILRLLNSEE